MQQQLTQKACSQSCLIISVHQSNFSQLFHAAAKVSCTCIGNMSSNLSTMHVFLHISLLLTCETLSFQMNISCNPQCYIMLNHHLAVTVNESIHIYCFHMSLIDCGLHSQQLLINATRDLPEVSEAVDFENTTELSTFHIKKNTSILNIIDHIIIAMKLMQFCNFCQLQMYFTIIAAVHSTSGSFQLHMYVHRHMSNDWFITDIMTAKLQN